MGAARRAREELRCVYLLAYVRSTDGLRLGLVFSKHFVARASSAKSINAKLRNGRGLTLVKPSKALNWRSNAPSRKLLSGTF